VAKNDEFIKLANQIADIVIEKGEEAAKNESVEPINLLIQKIGENIKLGEIFAVEGETLGSYVHNGKAGVLVSLEGGPATKLGAGTPVIARDIAMHIAAMKPEYKSKENIGTEARESVTSLFAEEVKVLDKPEEIKKKILENKIDTYFKERTLLDQTFIKNPNITIAELLKQAGGAKVKEFVRYSF
jgi:elongation factor Ts